MKAIALALFVAGAGASFALADDGGPGKGKAKAAESTSTGTSTAPVKVTLCHKAGKNKYVQIKVAKAAVKAHKKHGDVEPGADGKCPVPAPPATTTAP